MYMGSSFLHIIISHGT